MRHADHPFRIAGPKVPGHSLLIAWMVYAVLIRILSALTHSHWNFPDQWFQTGELAEQLWRGYGFYVQELGLHLRNLSWPAVLTLPLRLAHWMAPERVGLGLRMVQLFSGLLDLAMIWGWWEVMKSLSRAYPLSRWWRNVGLGLLILPFFAVSESISPSAEHISSILTWIALGLLARGNLVMAGFFCIGIGAVKYPCLLISAAIAASPPARNRKFLLGAAFGLVAFGLADTWAYGRPWESLWAYLHYNVVSGQAEEAFGRQSALVYLDLFKDHWFRGPLFLIGLPLLLASIYGWIKGFRRREPWAYAILFYGGAHLFVGHKEPRFMLPLESLLVWSGYYGLTLFMQSPVIPAFLAAKSLVGEITRQMNGEPPADRSRARYGKIILALLGLALLWNGLLVLRNLWGETWTAQSTYFAMTRHLRRNPGTCAVITVRSSLSLNLLPQFRLPSSPQAELGREAIPSPALGVFPIDRQASAATAVQEQPLEWVEHKPSCSTENPVLIHMHRPETYWTDRGCTLLKTGLTRILPGTLADWALRKDLVRGPWYRCPSAILSAFPREKISHPIVADGFRAQNRVTTGSDTDERSRGSEFKDQR